MQDDYQRLRSKTAGVPKALPPPRPANVIKIRRRPSPEQTATKPTPKRKINTNGEDSEEDYDDGQDVNSQLHNASSLGPGLTSPLPELAPAASPPPRRAGPLKYRPVYPDRSVYGSERITLRAQAAAEFMAWRKRSMSAATPLKA